MAQPACLEDVADRAFCRAASCGRHLDFPINPDLGLAARPDCPVPSQTLGSWKDGTWVERSCSSPSGQGVATAREAPIRPISERSANDDPRNSASCACAGMRPITRRRRSCPLSRELGLPIHGTPVRRVE
jgi:hypothetical protein